MKKSITQEGDYGCGIACFAFATGLSYQQAAEHLGPVQANSGRFYVRDLRIALNNYGVAYIHSYVKPNRRNKIYAEGTIVLIRRSRNYPTGHYLIRHHAQWMDPWINLPQEKTIKNARSGFRKRLPGQPMYAISLKKKSS